MRDSFWLSSDYKLENDNILHSLNNTKHIKGHKKIVPTSPISTTLKPYLCGCVDVVGGRGYTVDLSRT